MAVEGEDEIRSEQELTNQQDAPGAGWANKRKIGAGFNGKCLFPCDKCCATNETRGGGVYDFTLRACASCVRLGREPSSCTHFEVMDDGRRAQLKADLKSLEVEMAADTPAGWSARRLSLVPDEFTLEECAKRGLDPVARDAHTRKKAKVTLDEKDYEACIMAHLARHHGNPLVQTGANAATPATMVESAVDAYLDKRAISVLGQTLEQKRATLQRHLMLEKRWGTLRILVTWPGPEKGALFDNNLEVLYCCLHGEQRMMERLIAYLAAVPTERGWPDKKQRVEALEAAVRETTKLGSFSVKEEKGKFSCSFARPSTKKLQGATVQMVDAIFEGRTDDAGYAHWKLALEHYVKGVELLREYPTFDQDDPNFKALANAVADAFQTEADAFRAHILHETVSGAGHKIISNYFHDWFAGHVSDLIREYGCVSLFANDGTEAKNQDMVAIFYRQSLKGGCAGRGTVLKSKCDAGERWAVRMVFRLGGYDRIVQAKYNAGKAARRQRQFSDEARAKSLATRQENAAKRLRPTVLPGSLYGDEEEIAAADGLGLAIAVAVEADLAEEDGQGDPMDLEGLMEDDLF